MCGPLTLRTPGATNYSRVQDVPQKGFVASQGCFQREVPFEAPDPPDPGINCSVGKSCSFALAMSSGGIRGIGNTSASRRMWGRETSNRRDTCERRDRRTIPVFDGLVFFHYKLVVPRQIVSPGMAKKSQSFLCPRPQAITLMLEPPPNTLPMLRGIERR
jgi:hypothetical protein